MKPTTIAFACLALLAVRPLPAQDPDPQKAIEEIARRIDEQLQEIDRLLLESGKAGQSRKTPRDLLQQSADRSRTVEQGIDELMQKLTDMKNQSSSSSSEQQQRQQQQQQQQQQDEQQQGQQQGRQPRNRRDSNTPDFVQQEQGQQQQQQGEQQQGQQQPGQQQPGQQPQGRQPGDAQETPDQGRNSTGNRQLEPELGPGQPGQGDGQWGELQPYLNALKNKGAEAKVPEKYRKYWEAYLKSKQDKKQ